MRPPWMRARPVWVRARPARITVSGARPGCARVPPASPHQARVLGARASRPHHRIRRAIPAVSRAP